MIFVYLLFLMCILALGEHDVNYLIALIFCHKEGTFQPQRGHFRSFQNNWRHMLRPPSPNPRFYAPDFIRI